MMDCIDEEEEEEEEETAGRVATDGPIEWVDGCFTRGQITHFTLILPSSAIASASFIS